MTNKEIIENELNSIGYELGCWDNKINEIDKQEIEKIIFYLEEECIDIPIEHKNETHMIELKTVDKEKDLSMMEFNAYKVHYGVCY